MGLRLTEADLQVKAISLCDWITNKHYTESDFELSHPPGHSSPLPHPFLAQLPNVYRLFNPKGNFISSNIPFGNLVLK